MQKARWIHLMASFVPFPAGLSCGANLRTSFPIASSFPASVLRFSADDQRPTLQTHGAALLTSDGVRSEKS